MRLDLLGHKKNDKKEKKNGIDEFGRLSITLDGLFFIDYGVVMSAKESLIIGTRGSPLALAQAHETRDLLVGKCGLPRDQIQIEVISTQGDRIQDRALREFGGKGLFTKEIEAALLDGSIDLAVHSMKDVQTRLPDGLHIAAMLAREDVRDGFISLVAGDMGQLPYGAVVGTSSLRRQAQIKELRPDLEVVTFRGSVQTRLEKLARGEVAATFLAVAGLNRLGMQEQITRAVEPDVMLPAVAQGAIGLECRLGDKRVEALLKPLNDADTVRAVDTERAFLTRLDGSCRTPIAGLALLNDDEIHFWGQILAPDGSKSFMECARGPAAEAVGIGTKVAEILIERAGPDFMASLV